jgi:Uma2 family endonuclease
MSTAVLQLTDAPAKPAIMPRNHVILLKGVTWEEYLAYRDNPDNDGIRMHYGDGGLLLMATGGPHERIKMLLALILADWMVRTETNLMTFGQWTMQRETLEKGLEADNCYYVSSLAAVEGKKTLDLEVDPPPDLAIEVDITTHSHLKFSIYAALDVPEIWIWDEGAIAVFRRNEKGEYEQTTSRELPDFPFEAAADAINNYYDKGDLEVIRAFRAADASFEQ